MTTALKIVMLEDDDGHTRLFDRSIHRAGVSNDMARYASDLNDSLILLERNLANMSSVDNLAKVLTCDTRRSRSAIGLRKTDDNTKIDRCDEWACGPGTEPLSDECCAEAVQQLGLLPQMVNAPTGEA